MSKITMNVELKDLTMEQYSQLNDLVKSWGEKITFSEPLVRTTDAPHETKLSLARQFVGRVIKSPAQMGLLGCLRDHSPAGSFFIMAHLGIDENNMASFAGILASLNRNFNSTLGKAGVKFTDDWNGGGNGKMYALTDEARQFINEAMSDIHYAEQEK